MLIYVLSLLLVIVLMYVAHEVGHWAAARELGYKARINWREFHVNVEGYMKTSHLKKMYWTGIISGAVPIFFYLFTSWPAFFSGMILMNYYLWVGCNDDFKALQKLEWRK